MFTRLASAKIDVILAIFARKVGQTRAVVIIWQICTFRSIGTWFVAAHIDVNFAILSSEISFAGASVVVDQI